MKLLVLSNMHPRAGAPHGGAFVASRVRALRTLGVDVDLMALQVRSPRDSPRIDPSDVGWQAVDIPWGRPSRLLGRIQPGAFRDRRIAKWVMSQASNNYDAVLAHGMFVPPAGLVGQHVAQALEVPLVVQVHGSDVNSVMARFPTAHGRVLNNAAGVIFVSQPLEDRARSLGYQGLLSAVVPNGVDTGLFRPDRKRRNGKQVVFVGNLELVKGADRLSEIFTQLRQQDPSIEFTIVGDGSLKHRIAKDLEAANLTDVEWTGAIPQAGVADILRAADVLVMPSRSEGWPCVVLEAHASYCVVIATDVGGTAQALGAWEHIVDARQDVEKAIVAKTRRALAMEGSGAETRRARAETFDWRSTVQRELELIDRAIRS